MSSNKLVILSLICCFGFMVACSPKGACPRFKSAVDNRVRKSGLAAVTNFSFSKRQKTYKRNKPIGNFATGRTRWTRGSKSSNMAFTNFKFSNKYPKSISAHRSGRAFQNFKFSRKLPKPISRRTSLLAHKNFQWSHKSGSSVSRRSSDLAFKNYQFSKRTRGLPKPKVVSSFSNTKPRKKRKSRYKDSQFKKFSFKRRQGKYKKKKKREEGLFDEEMNRFQNVGG